MATDLKYSQYQTVTTLALTDTSVGERVSNPDGQKYIQPTYAQVKTLMSTALPFGVDNNGNLTNQNVSNSTFVDMGGTPSNIDYETNTGNLRLDFTISAFGTVANDIGAFRMAVGSTFTPEIQMIFDVVNDRHSISGSHVLVGPFSGVLSTRIQFRRISGSGNIETTVSDFFNWCVTGFKQ